MTDMFDDEDDLVEVDPFAEPDEEVEIDTSGAIPLDARRRLENMLEEKRLRDELEEFDY